MVEFALILLPFLLLVGGIIYFGIALNYWLDTQRLANQGARWAVVNEYPGCPRTGPPTPCAPTLQRQIACQAVADGLKPTVSISFPNGPSASTRGNPVKVIVSTSFTMLPIVGVGTITLRGEATMRIEQNATRYLDADTYTPGPCP
jgi:TadE-like protein